jgi:4-hydroxymandelate oxidase
MGVLADSLEARARQVLPEAVFRYIRQGARDGVTASEAAAAWDRIRFLPHAMRDMTEVATATSLLSTQVRTPVAVAPTTMQRGVHPGGEVAMARAVADAGSLMVLSSNAGFTFEEVGATGVNWWLQLYVTPDRTTCRPLVTRAVAAGARALVLTVDTPVVGTKYDGPAETVWDVADPSWLRANFDPGIGGAAGGGKARDLGPRDIEWLREAGGAPVVVKGVLRPDDARRCVDAGASAVWVSNHGGRQLDHAAATADVLAGVVSEVGGDVEVYVDGGVRKAEHVLAALALGARGVFLGRLPLYALASGGQAGVTDLLGELELNLVEALVLSGCADASCVPADILWRPGNGLRDGQ